MSELKVRRIDFQLDNSLPYQAFPQTPEWGEFVNVITLIAPAFERYFIKTCRRAIPLINDAALKADAEAFCAQEAQHSKQHMAHFQVLAHHYPGLVETEQKIRASYDALFAEESDAFHFGYAATVELTFGPIAKFIIENRDILFKGGNRRIASFILWHLVEEFEHRNAAIDVYKHQVGSYWYRMKTAPKVMKHIYDIYQISLDGFKQHVYQEDVNAMPKPHRAFDIVPLKSRLAFFYHLLCTLLPYHNPDNLKQPDWVTEWFRDEERGFDMRNYFSEGSG
jgi:predicted metal-dependent hydrolase